MFSIALNYKIWYCLFQCTVSMKLECVSYQRQQCEVNVYAHVSVTRDDRRPQVYHRVCSVSMCVWL